MSYLPTLAYPCLPCSPFPDFATFPPDFPRQKEQVGLTKNVSTLWRELEKRMSKDIALDGVDPLHVIEWAMRYFFGLAQTGREAGAPLEEVRKCVREAAQLAGLAAPYRHPRLSGSSTSTTTNCWRVCPRMPRPRSYAQHWHCASRN